MAKKKPDFGFVYVLSNEYMPGIYKIGYTGGDPMVRQRDLARPTGVPGYFEYSMDNLFFVDDPYSKEQAIFEALSDYRIWGGKEFFALDLDEIHRVIGEVLYNASDREEIKLCRAGHILAILEESPRRFGYHTRAKIWDIFEERIMKTRDLNCVLTLVKINGHELAGFMGWLAGASMTHTNEVYRVAVDILERRLQNK